jgi:signal transduction histidine kinase
LEQSRRQQKELRLLSHRLLSVQEEERKRISRELHDVIAQFLTSINLRLTALKMAARANTQEFTRNIERTQQLVEKSVDIVHRFAFDLRPAVLDDLGLVPALHSFSKNFSKQTGIRVNLTAVAVVSQLDNDCRTVLYRVAQEALTNVARHAQASRVDVSIQRLPKTVHMQIKDNGKSFDVKRIFHAGKSKRLGLLGMRERVEMVGGQFTVESSHGQGTTIQVQIPFKNSNRAKCLSKRGSRLL